MKKKEPNERDFGIKTLITNNHNQNVSIIYFNLIPWYFRVYINSLQIENDGQIKPGIYK